MQRKIRNEDVHLGAGCTDLSARMRKIGYVRAEPEKHFWHLQMDKDRDQQRKCKLHGITLAGQAEKVHAV